MYAKKKSVSMKVVGLLLAICLLIGCVAGGTIAYLIAEPKTVTNTFVAGNIGTLTLTETYNKDSDNDGINDEWTAIVTPGKDLDKDPEVSLTDNNVDAYVFVKLECDEGQAFAISESNGVTKVNHSAKENEIYWKLEAGWNKVSNNPRVYYREVSANNTASWGIIQDDKVYVSSDLTQNDIKNFTLNLTFTAYAIQQLGFDDAVTAWAKIMPNP